MSDTCYSNYLSYFFCFKVSGMQKKKKNEKQRGNCQISNMEGRKKKKTPSVKVLSNTSNPFNTEPGKAAVMIKARDVSSLRSCFQKASRHIWAATVLL